MGNTASSSKNGAGNGQTGADSASNTSPPRSRRIRSGSSQQQQQQLQPQASTSSGSAQGSTSRSGRSNSAAAAAAAVPEEPPSPPLFPQDARVDNGHLVPLSNIYPNAPQDWRRDVVQSLIVERKLAPFYRGLEDCPCPGAATDDHSSFDRDEVDETLDTVGDERSKSWRKTIYNDADRKAEVAMYKKASECPICFLYYPPLINTSRCCDQPICTECFVQIKRADPTTTNLISEPAACPYCVEPNFGVTYIPPPQNRRTGLGTPRVGQKQLIDHGGMATDSALAQKGMAASQGKQRPTDQLDREDSADSSELDMGPAAAAHARRKSLSHTSAEVVTVDAVQTDWEAKLATVRATAARRAARRVVFRQIGERLVPVGISSGREINPNHLITDEQGRLILTTPVPIVGQGGIEVRASGGALSSMVEAGPGARDGQQSGSGFGSPSRLLGRSGRRRGTHGQGSFGEADHRMLMGGDLEELMVMEAMRLSMLEEEERTKRAEKEAKAKAKKEAKEAKAKRKSIGGDSGFSIPGNPEASTSTSTNDTRARASADSPRLSLDAARSLLSGARGKSKAEPTVNTSYDSGNAASPSNSATAASISANGQTGSTGISILTMPPMQRNDTSASLAQHNLPEPLVPTRSPEALGRANGGQKQPEVHRTHSDLLL